MDMTVSILTFWGAQAVLVERESMGRRGRATVSPEKAETQQKLAIQLWRRTMLSFCMLMATAIAAAQGTGSQSQTRTAGYMTEARSCATCHAAPVKDFADNPHAHEMGGKPMTCASCHGDAKAHIPSGDPAKIFDTAKASAQQVDAMCLTCHAGKHASFERSTHGRGNLSCVSCHSIHSAGAKKHLLLTAEPGLCYQCHGDVKPQFALPHHHPVKEGLLRCSDCHDPHGKPDERLASTAVQQNRVCTNCHTQMAGPFVYQHAAVTLEGCTACHFPHGGSNPHLLIKANVDTMCELCHKPVPNYATGVHIRTALDRTNPAPPCTSCHRQMHGSNTSDVFLSKDYGKQSIPGR